MKSQTRFLIFVFLLLFSFQSNAQWTASTGLDGMVVYDIEIFDSTIFLSGGSNGVYSKPVNNDSWIKLDGLYGIFNIESTDSVLFAQGFNSGVCLFRSFDDGDSWEELDLFTYYDIEDMSTIKNNIIITKYDSLLLSNDNGESWVDIGGEMTVIEDNYSLTFDTILFRGGGFIDSIFRSDNLGQTWTPIVRLGLPDYYGKRINGIVEFNDSLWAATEKGVFVFGGNDIGWLSRNDGISIQKIKDLLIFNDTLYCSTKTGVYYLDQNSWVNESQGLETKDVNCLEQDNDIKYAGTSCGPFQKQGEDDWNPIYEGLNHLTIYAVSVILPDIFALTEKGLFKSTDRGESFEFMSTEQFTKCYNLVATDSLLYITSDSGFYISDDYGLTWAPRKQGLNDEFCRAMAISHEYCFAATSHGLYRTKHINLVWEKITGLSGPSNVSDVAVNDSIVVMSDYYDTFTSIDNGTYFDTVINYYGELFAKDQKFYGLYYYDKLITSIDGFNWVEHMYPDVSWYWATSDIDVNKEAIVIGGSKLGMTYYDIFVLLSYDKGDTWMEISYGLPVPNWPTLNHVGIFDNRLFASPSRNGLWYRDDLLVGEKELNEVEPGEILLYPNPVKGLLTVDASDSFKGSVQLKIYDINGRIVKQQKLPSLKSSIEFAGLKPGIYFLQFVGDGKTVTQKIVKQ